MIWAILLLIGVVMAIHWFDYSRNVEEYTFAQPAGLSDIGSNLLNDKTPIVVEVGALPWRPEVAGVATWSVEVDEGTELPISSWLSGGEERKEILNGISLAEEMGLLTGLGELDGARPFWWLPGFQRAEVGVLSSDDKLGLTWISAERRWIGCSAGAPIILWLVHSRYRRFLPSLSSVENGGVDPWELTIATAPWVGRVQFVEVRIRPGWCVGLPAHWGYAIRSEAESGVKEGETGPGPSWYWTADQHSPLSVIINQVSMGSQ